MLARDQIITPLRRQQHLVCLFKRDAVLLNEKIPECAWILPEFSPILLTCPGVEIGD